METRVFNLVANTKCEMNALRRAVISEFVNTESGCGGTAPTAITISLECWRDAVTNKLHCKLSVSLSAA